MALFGCVLKLMEFPVSPLNVLILMYCLTKQKYMSVGSAMIQQRLTFDEFAILWWHVLGE